MLYRCHRVSEQSPHVGFAVLWSFLTLQQLVHLVETLGHFLEGPSCRVVAGYQLKIMRLRDVPLCGKTELVLPPSKSTLQAGAKGVGRAGNACGSLSRAPETPPWHSWLGQLPSGDTHWMALMWAVWPAARAICQAGIRPTCKVISPGWGWQFQEVIYILLLGQAPWRRRPCPPVPSPDAPVVAYGASCSPQYARDSTL